MRIARGLTQREVADRIGAGETARSVGARERADPASVRRGAWDAHVAALGADDVGEGRPAVGPDVT